MDMAMHCWGGNLEMARATKRYFWPPKERYSSIDAAGLVPRRGVHRVDTTVGSYGGDVSYERGTPARERSGRMCGGALTLSVGSPLRPYAASYRRTYE